MPSIVRSHIGILLAFAAFVGVVCIGSVGTLDAQINRVEATTSRAAKQEVLAALPYSELTHEARAKLDPVLNRPSLYRRLPIETVQCDPDLHIFLVRYPEVIVSIWQMMGVTKCSSERIGQFAVRAADGEGTVSNIELVYGTPDLHIFFAEGTYDGPLYPTRLSGRCVLILHTEYGFDRAGRPVVRNQLDTFVRIDNLAADLVAKTFHPLIGRTADHNFTETTRFLSRISDAAETNSVGVQDMADRLENVAPEVKDQFGRIASVVESRAMQRMVQSGSRSPMQSPYTQSSANLPSSRE